MFIWMLGLLDYCRSWFWNRYFHWRHPRSEQRGWRRSKSAGSRPVPVVRRRRKADWVQATLLSLFVELENASCRTVADHFNRLYAYTGESVGKTYVNELQRAHQAETRLNRKALKQRRHGPGPKNMVWGLDLTGKTDAAG